MIAGLGKPIANWAKRMEQARGYAQDRRHQSEKGLASYLASAGS